MPLKPRSTQDWAPLPEMQFLPVEIDDVPKQAAGMDSSEQVKFPVKVIEGPFQQVTTQDGRVVPGRTMVWLGLTIAPSNSGEPSKLRKLLEAIYGRALSNDEAEAIDLETLKGRRFVMVGQRAKNGGLKPTGFRPYVPGDPAYQAAGAVAAPAPPPATAAPPPPPPPANGTPPPPPPSKPVAQQFSADGQYGWDGSQWLPADSFSNQPQAAAAAPPPPPAAPAQQPAATPPAGLNF